MTFKKLFPILVYLQALRISMAGPAVYTAITKTIDMMEMLESVQENSVERYGGQNVYSSNSQTEDEPLSTTTRTSDAMFANNTNDRDASKRWTFQQAASGPNVAVRSGPSFSYIVASGPSISIVARPNIHTISYSAPGRVSISQGSSGSPYVFSFYNTGATPVSYAYWSTGTPYHAYVAGSTLPVHSMATARTDEDKTKILDSSELQSGPTVVSGHSRLGDVQHSVRNPDILNTGSSEVASKIIDHIGDGSVTAAAYTFNGHPDYVEAYRSLQTASRIISRILSAPGVNNIAGIRLR